MISGGWYVFEQEFCSCKRCDEWIAYRCFCLSMEPAPLLLREFLYCAADLLSLLWRSQVSGISSPIIAHTFIHFWCPVFLQGLLLPGFLILHFFSFFSRGGTWMWLQCCHQTKLLWGLFPLACHVLYSLGNGCWYQSGVCLERDKKSLVKSLCMFREFWRIILPLLLSSEKTHQGGGWCKDLSQVLLCALVRCLLKAWFLKDPS